MRLLRCGGAVSIFAALFSAVNLGASPVQSGQPAGVVHTYYIAADEVDWNYIPSDYDHAMARPYEARSRMFIDNSEDHIGRLYKKAVYREYVDATFTKLKPRGAAWEHLGVLGPVLRGEVGDTLRIVFKNNAQFPFSMHAHGVRYDQASDGMQGVPSGSTFTYTWIIDPRSGPGAGEPSSKMWLYHSHANEQRDVAAGLLGVIIVSAKGTVKADGTPRDVDREFVGVLYTIDENQSPYLTGNIARYIANPSTLRRTLAIFSDFDGQPVNVGFLASNLRETINGYMFGNTPGFTMRQGDRVRWYTAGMAGTHTAHWHANTVLLDQNMVDVVPLNAAEMHTTDMVADNPGTWMFHCHVEGHLAIGMYAHYVVEPAASRKITHLREHR